MSEKKQLPKVRFKTNIPITMTLPFGDGRRVQSRYDDGGDQYLYTVEIEGASHALFATEKLHEKLQTVGKGGTAKVVKAEVDGPGGKTYQEFQVEVIEQGELVAPKESSGGSKDAPARAQGAAAAPGSRPGAEGRLVELAAAYAACVDEAKGVWHRAGMRGWDTETIHSTAASFFIGLTREGYDLAPFVNTYGESEGMKLLRKLVERVKTEGHLEAVRDFYGERLLGLLPTDPQEARTLYVELREAVKSATEAAADATTPVDDEEEDPPEAQTPAPTAESEEFPPEDDLPTSLGGSDDLEPHQAQVKKIAIEVYGSAKDERVALLLSKITKKEGGSYGDLTEKQAKVLERSLEAARRAA